MKDEKHYDEILRDIGEQSALEEFDRTDKEHNFSKKYEKQKEALMAKARFNNKKVVPMKRKWSKTVKAMVASAAVLILLPITVFAAYKFYTINVKDKNYAKEVNVEDVIKEVKPVEMKVSYLPAGIKESEIDAWKYWDEAGEHWLTLNLMKVDTEAKFVVDDIDDKQEIELNDGTRVLLGKNAGREGYHGAVFYDQQGYIVEFWAGDVANEELIKTIEGISLNETTGEGTQAYSLAAHIGDQTLGKDDKLTEATSEASGVKGTDPLNGNKIALDEIHKIKENFIYETAYNVYTNDLKSGELEMSVEKVEVLDDISGIDEASKAFGKDDKELADEAGKLLPHERAIGEWGDGIDAPTWKTTETQMVNRKLLSITVRMKNQTGVATNDMNIFPRLSLLTEDNGAYQLLEKPYFDFNNCKEAYSMDTYGDGNSGKGFYFVDFGKDEEKLITITFLVDEDELDKAFLSYEGGGLDEPENSYVDVRQ